MKQITITKEYVTLGQFLKFTGIADSGAHAKMMIKDGHVIVNGEVEMRRGRKLYHDDTVQFEDEIYQIVNEN